VGLAPAHRQLLALAGLDHSLVVEDAPLDSGADDQVSAPRSSDSQKSKRPSWSWPIWWK
jgi:hypothetical protein